MSKYKVGDMIVYRISENPVLYNAGYVLGIYHVNSKKTFYWVKELINPENGSIINQNLLHYYDFNTIDSQYVVPLSDLGSPESENWCKEHMGTISFLFDRDVSKNVCIMYDDKKQLDIDGFSEYMPCDWIQLVLGKYVIVF